MTILDKIVADTRARLARHPIDLDGLEARARAHAAGPDALAALSRPGGPHVIAEIKRRSPSAGSLREEVDPVAFAMSYVAAGATAISVLTEPTHFGGSILDLELVAKSVPAPVLKKDFIVGRRQIAEARLAGASLVLLIAAVLSDDELSELRAYAESLGMHALVEAHDGVEIGRAVASGARIVGINNRDLRTFAIDLATSERLRPLIPDGIVAVSESGVDAREDVVRLGEAGFDAVLVGSSLMRAADPGAALAALLGQTSPTERPS